MLGRIWWIIGAALICGLAAFLISDFAIPRKYQSNVSMYVRNKEDQKQDINNSDLSVSKSLVSTYIVILNNDAVMEQVGEQLLKQHTPEELSGNFTIKNGQITNESLKSAFTMAAVNNTEVLKITATTKNADLSAELCNNVSRYDGVKYGYRTKNYTNIDELYTNSRTEAFGEFLKSAILFGSETLSTENYSKVYDKAMRVRRVIRDDMAAMLADCDALLMPAVSALSYDRTLVERDKYLPYKENFFTAPASITGFPVVVAGGVQFVGNAFSEELLLDLAELV